MFSILKKLFTKSLRHSPVAKKRKSGTTLRVESLEDRCLPAPILVTNTFAGGVGSLAAAIATVNPGNDSQIDIVIGNGMNQIPAGSRITAPVGGFLINRPLTIIAVNPAGGQLAGSVITLAGNGGPIFQVAQPNGKGTTINNVVLTGGTGVGALVDTGGGALNLTNDQFNNNSSNVAGGGAVSITGANAVVNITACQFDTDNSLNGGAISVPGNQDVVSIGGGTSFANNAATGNGGAISVTGNQDTLIVNNGTFTSNTATIGGGAISVTGSPDTLSVNNATFTTNTGANGGAIDESRAGNRLQVVSSSFITNSATGVAGGAINTTVQTLLQSDTFQGNTAFFTGGAVADVGGAGSLMIAGSVFSAANTALSGGAVAFANVPTSIWGSTFTDNRATTFAGGAINAVTDQPLGITSSQFENNTAGSSGGAVNYAGVSLSVSSSSFTDNEAGRRGGAVLYLSPAVATGQMTFGNDTFTSNSATVSGGAVAVIVNGRYTGTITGSLFQGNAASGSAANDGGGAIFLSQLDSGSGSTTISNSTIFENGASNNGAGICIQNGGNNTVVLQSLTITENCAGNDGSGVFIAPPVGGGEPPEVGNCIIAGNVGDDIIGTVNSQGFNVIGIEDGSIGWQVGPGLAEPDQVGSAAMPLPSGLDHAGPTPSGSGLTNTIKLLITSPALFRGDRNLLGSPDQRGMIRTLIVSAGAFDPLGIPPGPLALNNPGAQNNMAGAAVNLGLAWTPSNGDPVTFTAFGLPPGLGINSLTGVISGTILNFAGAIGQFNPTVVVVDTVTGQTVSQTWNWTVCPPTVTVSNPGNQKNVTGDAVDVTLTSSDSDGYPLTFTATNLPAGLSIDGSTGEITGTVSGTGGVSWVTVTATDSSGAGSSQTFQWIVNSPTVSLTSPGDQTNFDGDNVNLNLTASGTDGNLLTFAASQLPSGLSIDSGTGQITGTIADDVDGTFWTTVTATDSGTGANSSVAFTWTVTPPPKVSLSNPGLQTNLTADSVDVTFSSADSDGYPLTLTATNLPAGLSIDGSTGEITGTVTSTGGVYWVTVTATDSSGVSSSEAFEWIVNSPTVSLSNPGDQSNLGGDSVNLDLTASDTDGNPLTFSASELPSGLSISSGTGQITGTIADDVVGTFWITVTATDSGTGASSSVVFAWSVNPPTVSLSNPGLQTNLTGDNVDVTFSSSDSDSYPLTFTASNLPAGLSINSNTGEITGTVTGTGGVSWATVTATDISSGVSSSQSFEWIVNSPTVSLTSPGDQTNLGGDNVNLDLTASDTDGNPLTFTASDLPSGLSIDSGTGQITGTIANDVDGPFSITVTATDTGTGANSSVVFTWTVNPPTVTVSNPGNQTNVIGDTVDVTFSSSDSDGYPLTFAASGLPAGLSVNSATGEITGTIAAGDVGSYGVAVAAVDASSGATDIETFTWTVNQATPSITWPNPAAITVGTALGGTQLDASANVAGTFSYTLADGVTSANGAVLSVGNNQVLNVTFTPSDTTDYTSATAQVQIDVDAAATVSNVGATTSNTTYTVGNTVYVTVAFSEAVYVTGTPTLGLNSGGTAYYTSGSGSSTLTFAYPVGSGDGSADLDYTSTSALALSGGTVTDGNGASAVLTLPATGTSSLPGDNLVISGAAAATLVQQTSGSGDAVSFTVSWPATTTAGDLLVVAVELTGTGMGGDLIPTPSGWTLEILNSGQMGMETYLFAQQNAGAESSLTLSLSPSFALPYQYVACEFSGVQTSGALDQTASASGSGGTASSGTTGTTAQASELALSFAGAFSYSYCSGPTNGFTTIATAGGCLLSYEVLSSTETVSSQATVSASASWEGSIVTFEL